jgi:hypothetical protein
MASPQVKQVSYASLECRTNNAPIEVTQFFEFMKNYPSMSPVSLDAWLLSPSALSSGGWEAEEELFVTSQPLLYSSSGILGL